MITMDQLRNTVQSLIDADAEVKRVTDVLKDRKEDARKLREDVIPASFDELDITSLELTSGQKVTVKQEVYASIPKARKDEAHQWLNDNGFGGLIKTDVTVNYGKGDHDIAVGLFTELQGRGLEAIFIEGVNTGTLKAFLRDEMSKGNDVPLELFGAHPVMTTKIK